MDGYERARRHRGKAAEYRYQLREARLVALDLAMRVMRGEPASEEAIKAMHEVLQDGRTVLAKAPKASRRTVRSEAEIAAALRELEGDTQ